jgi:dTDP-4-amino-4,6-dideoxygalactose transaminase
MEKRWEVGSEFDWSNSAIAGSTVPNMFPDRHELFSTATGILLSIHQLLKAGKAPVRVHLPSLFCMHVASHIQKVAEICWYRDLPTEPTPDFDSLRPHPGDLVVAVNLFGIRQQKPWQDWLQHHQDVVLIEDHTHDPFSNWAEQSTAHYAIASLRKTLPIPDGAIVWSPQGIELPKPSLAQPWGTYYKLMAMLLKRAFLDGAEISKDTYRLLQTQGEKYLSDETDAGVSIFTREILNCLNISELRQRREANIKQFIELISRTENPDWKPLFKSWFLGTVPFNSVLVCQNNQIREELRQFLVNCNIFPAVHWQQPLGGISSHDKIAIDLSNRILTIPLDYRYSSEDISQISRKTNEFSSILTTA